MLALRLRAMFGCRRTAALTAALTAA